jgi:hypothetical protein
MYVCMNCVCIMYVCIFFYFIKHAPLFWSNTTCCNLHVSVCMYVCMYVGVYVYVCIMCMYVYMFMYVCMYNRIPEGPSGSKHVEGIIN